VSVFLKYVLMKAPRHSA